MTNAGATWVMLQAALLQGAFSCTGAEAVVVRHEEAAEGGQLRA